MIVLITWHALLLALEKIMISSAKVRKGIVIRSLTIGNPISLLTLLSNCIFRAKTSAQRMKRKGESGSPCRSPLCGRNSFVGPLLTRTEKETVVTHSLIQLITVWLKANFFKTANRKSYSILSYAFFISNFKAIQPSLLFLDLNE